MISLIEQLVVDTIEEYERWAGEYSRKAEALRAEWAALNRPVDRSVDSSADPDGWIEWSGGPIPLPFEKKVRIRWLDGTEGVGFAGQVRWSHSGVPSDVIAYRVAS